MDEGGPECLKIKDHYFVRELRKIQIRKTCSEGPELISHLATFSYNYVFNINCDFNV